MALMVDLLSVRGTAAGSRIKALQADPRIII
jgi:hypothetical protein